MKDEPIGGLLASREASKDCVVCCRANRHCLCDPGPIPEAVPSWEVTKVYGEDSPGKGWEPFAAASESGVFGCPVVVVLWRKLVEG